MTGYMTTDANLARLGELRQRADRRRAAHPGEASPATYEPAPAPIAIRRATAADRRALARLAALDSAAPLVGQILIAEVGAEPQAAIEIASGTAIADPFHPTTELIELLSVRAERLRREGATAPRRRLRLRPRSAYRAA